MVDRDRISIPVIFDRKITDLSNLKEICYGIEEQGAFFRKMKEVNIINPLDVAYNFAKNNAHGIAIVLTKDEVLVHHEKLKKDSPIFRYDTSVLKMEGFRNIGSNVVRIISNRPFNLDI